MTTDVKGFDMQKQLMAVVGVASVMTGLVLGACAGGGDVAKSESAAAARVDDAPVQSREAVLTVFGMSCPLCANNVDQTLLEIPGVESVAVDMSTGRAVVKLDGKTPVTRRQLANAVDRSGFTLQSVESH